jgi:hypothetical protein
MINSYTEIIEQIIVEMNASISSGRNDVSHSEYLLWLTFLRQIHPDSDLLKVRIQTPMPREPNTSGLGKEQKQFSDVREIMILAETKKYPTWFVQPKFSKALLLEYDHGELQNVFLKQNGNWEKTERDTITCIPKTIQEFSGTISGTCYQAEKGSQQFVANDVDRKIDFQKRMELLQNIGLTVAEFVLFPTDKIPTISSSKLEAFFRNYIAKAQEQGLLVDGVVIISDTMLVANEDKDSNRIAFSPTLIIN